MKGEEPVRTYKNRNNYVNTHQSGSENSKEGGKVEN